jgi:hypothetical protein
LKRLTTRFKEKSISPSRRETPVSKFIEQQANKYRFNDRELSVMAGFTSTAAPYMFMRGETRVPLDAVPALADALECNGAELMIWAMAQFFTPDLFVKIRARFEALAPTDREMEYLQVIRDVFGSDLPEMTVPMISRLQQGLKECARLAQL